MELEREREGKSISSEETDLLRRSTKKIKRRREDGSLEEIDDNGSGSFGMDFGEAREVSYTPSRLPGSSFMEALTSDNTKLWYQGDSDDEGTTLHEAVDTQIVPDCPRITVLPEELSTLRAPWRKALIVKVLGRAVGYRLLTQRMKQIWQLQHSIDVVDVGEGYYLVRFTCKADYVHVLLDGPWVILGHYLTVSKWRPDFRPLANELPSTMVWIRFSGVPIEYFNENLLLRLGGLVGRAIKTDKLTADASRGRFARVCVELNLKDALVSKVGINNVEFTVEYEGLHLICFECGKYGHKQDGCPSLMPPMGTEVGNDTVPGAPAIDSLHTGVESGPKFGPWMLAQSHSRDTVSRTRRTSSDKIDNPSLSGNGGRRTVGPASAYSPVQKGKAVVSHGNMGNHFSALMDAHSNAFSDQVGPTPALDTIGLGPFSMGCAATVGSSAGQTSRSIPLTSPAHSKKPLPQSPRRKLPDPPLQAASSPHKATNHPQM
ncbi:unnamed protein product [Camellia sinensis]